jgi:hypothetical protein
MYAVPSSLFKFLFTLLDQSMARRRAAWEARCQARRLQTRFVRPRIEDLEERLVLDAYTFVNPVTGLPSQGSWTDGANWTDLSNAAKDGTVPTSNDTADIPSGASCTLSATASVSGVSVEGSLTVGGPSGTTSGTLDTISMSMGATAGTVAIGAPGTGMGGAVDVSGTMTDSSGGPLTVGGSGGSSGSLKVYSLTAGTTTINANGAIEIKHDASFLGFTTLVR